MKTKSQDTAQAAAAPFPDGSVTEAVQKHDIVQADPGATEWGPALVVVTEIRSWGIIGYTSIPKGGDAYIRLAHGTFEPTGGKAVFVPAEDAHV